MHHDSTNRNHSTAFAAAGRALRTDRMTSTATITGASYTCRKLFEPSGVRGTEVAR